MPFFSADIFKIYGNCRPYRALGILRGFFEITLKWPRNSDEENLKKNLHFETAMICKQISTALEFPVTANEYILADIETERVGLFS